MLQYFPFQGLTRPKNACVVKRIQNFTAQPLIIANYRIDSIQSFTIKKPPENTWVTRAVAQRQWQHKPVQVSDHEIISAKFLHF